MTTYVAARDAIVTYINTNWTTDNPTIPVYYENTTSVDLDVVGDTFITVGVDFVDALQSDIDTNPGLQVFGDICVRLFVREGLGTRTLLQLVDYLTNLLKFQGLGGVHVLSPRVGRKRSKDGWLELEVATDFTFFSRF